MPSRSLDDILRDVIEALEPLDTTTLSTGLWVHGCAGTRPNLRVDTGTLIDAAKTSGKAHVTVSTGEDKVWASTHDGALSWEHRGAGHKGATSTRELVIVALALALGVETEK